MKEVWSRSKQSRLAAATVVVITSAALLWAPPASGAGDPVATGTVFLKLTKGFKAALKRDRVRIKPRHFRIRPTVSTIDPVNGTGKVSLRGKLRFRGHGKRLVARNLVARIGNDGGNIKGRVGGRKITLLRLRAKPGRGARVDRIGFGAAISRISARLARPLAKEVNRKLDLGSLVPSRRVARLRITQQPQTVVVTGGTAIVNVPLSYLTTEQTSNVTGKLRFHCVDPFGGVSAIQPGVLTPTPPDDPSIAARFTFPVTGGTVSPAGNDGVIQMAGGVSIASGRTISMQPMSCAMETPGPSTSHSLLDFTQLAPNLALNNVQANAAIGGTSPGCNLSGQSADCPTAAFPGDKGPAIGQVLDMSGATVSADANAKSVVINEALIRNNALSSLVLNGLFPNATDPYDASRDFVDGDKFGIASLTVSTR